MYTSVSLTSCTLFFITRVHLLIQMSMSLSTISKKFLGVIIDDKLNYGQHIAYIKTKISKGIGVLCRAKKFFDVKTLVNLYYSFVHPYLTYCNEVWGATFVTYLDPLVILQKRAVRIICGVNRRASTEDLFKMLSIVPFSKLHTFNVHKFLYKVYNGIVPSCVAGMLTFNSDVHNHQTRQASNVHIKHASSDPRKRSLGHQACIMFNKRDDVNYDLPFHTFKYFVKNILLFT